MCGIAGKVYRDRAQRVAPQLLTAMGQALLHRGPDDGGQCRSGPAGLCMRRLQIIDIDGGHQPMENETGALKLVFNGEIYNYRQLRQELLEKGHVFRTESDTETILHLYEESGLDFLQYLRGMFALALWDEEEQTLILARDRLGKKPLYYAHSAAALTFASELGALLCDEQVGRDIDPQAIDEYLTYLFVPHPRTIYREVKKLPAASYALYREGQLQIERYWDVNYEPEAENRSLGEVVEQLEPLLRQAVQLRMIADVPLGAFLSGGLDSSLIVALMQQFSARPVKTFSIGFEQSSFNELAAARQVAQALGTEHEEYTVTYEAKDLLPKMLEHFGEPFADSSAIPLYHLSRVTRNDVTVALSGDGGDEVFGGYRRYQARRLADIYNSFGGRLGRGAIEWLNQHLREPAVYYGTSPVKKFKRFVEYARAVSEMPQTSWAFFLPKRKKWPFIRKILPIYYIRRMFYRVWQIILIDNTMRGDKTCCGWT